jgi:hypothetical protein
MFPSVVTFIAGFFDTDLTVMQHHQKKRDLVLIQITMLRKRNNKNKSQKRKEKQRSKNLQRKRLKQT